MTNRRSFAIGLLLVLVGACLSKTIPTPVPLPGEIVLDAQTLPITKTVAWDDADTLITSYTVTLDGATIGTPTGQTLAVTFATPGVHTIVVTATNLWGSASSQPLQVNVKLPTAPSNLRFP